MRDGWDGVIYYVKLTQIKVPASRLITHCVRSMSNQSWFKGLCQMLTVWNITVSSFAEVYNVTCRKGLSSSLHSNILQKQMYQSNDKSCMRIETSWNTIMFVLFHLYVYIDILTWIKVLSHTPGWMFCDWFWSVLKCILWPTYVVSTYNFHTGNCY